MIENKILFDDGHKPGSTSVPTTIIDYKNKNSSKFVSFYDDVLSEEWHDRVYKYALKKGKPWGVYIKTKMVEDATVDPEELWKDKPEIAIALISLRSLMFGRASGLIGKDKEAIDGVVVWCLTSFTSNTVEYHIDYAELYRYETNIIYPPIYGGVYHASPLEANEMVGGDFMVNMDGLKHYEKFGYKGALRTQEELLDDLDTGNWATVKYKGNRGLVFDGNLPHLATPIKSLPKLSTVEHVPTPVGCNGNGGVDTPGPPPVPTPISAPSTTHKYGSVVPSIGTVPNTKARVILGFNCFPVTIAPCCERAPEHSEAFNRTVKLYQAMTAAGMPVCANTADIEVEGEVSLPSVSTSNDTCEKPKKKTGLTVQDLKKNPALAKLIIQAANVMKQQKNKET